MWEGAIRNLIPDANLRDYLTLILGKYGPAYRPDDVYIGDLVSALSALDAGITTIVDWSHIQNTPAHTDAAIRALQESGMRAMFAYGFPQLAGKPWWADSSHQFPGDIARLRKQYFSSDDQLTTLFLASPGGAPQEIVNIWKAARDVGAPITIHVGVGEFGKSAFLEKVHAIEPLRSDTTYVHACTLNDTEWKLIKDSGGTVSMASYVEKLMGHGNPPIQKVIDLGIRPSLSVDVETSVPNDFFNQMRSVFTQQKNEVWERKLSGDKNPPKFLTVREVLEFATVEGARANHLEKKVGSLTPGKEADIILLRHDMLNVMPMNNAVGAVVTSMGPQNVDTVLIAGKVMKRDGKLVGVDMARLARLGAEAKARVYKAAGVPDKLI
jgi:cytosine/adenosine deaminase-related metal-dependent hydrolase